MANFANKILEATGGEEIIAISISPWNNSSARYDAEPGVVADHALGCEPVSWAEAFPVLNYEYDDGYGGQDCHDIIAWTATKVLYVHEYDGSTSVQSVPRNPAPFLADGW